MPRSDAVKIALLGCGKLGQGFYKLWLDRRQKIKEQIGIDFAITHILIRNKRQKRDVFGPWMSRGISKPRTFSQ